MEKQPITELDAIAQRRASVADSIIGPDAFDTSGLFNPTVSFEEYLYWAEVSHAEEDHGDQSLGLTVFGRSLRTIISTAYRPTQPRVSSVDAAIAAARDETKDTKNRPATVIRPLTQEDPGTQQSMSEHRPGTRPVTISDAEYAAASRAVRTASWSAVFYLLTMDILGPFSVPWAFAAVSWLGALFQP